MVRLRHVLPIAVVLALPFLYWLIPLCEGRAWNALGPYQFNILNPPEGYHGSVPGVPITAESWGASTVEIPFRARLRHCLKNFELPLWNPNQGLGQPFAAEGEGCPYFPVVMVRVLLPYTWGNFVSLGFYYIAALALYSFLRELMLTRAASVLGSAAFICSGALSLNLARHNYSDQLCMIPIIFWSAARAIRLGTFFARLTLAVMAGLHLLAGLVQIAMPSAIVCCGFCIVYAWVRRGIRPRWVLAAGGTLLFFILGNGLASFSLLPVIEAIRTSFSKNPEMLSMLPMPYANAIALFFPQIFGQYFQSWIPGNYPEIVAWDDLFAFGGTLALMLVVVGWSGRRWISDQHRPLFWFFSLGGVFLVLRYISFPPVAIVNMLPLIGRQSPKHANGITVYCFAVAAAFAANSLRSLWSRRSHLGLAALVVATVSCVLTLVIRQGGWAGTNLPMAHQPLIATALVVVAMWIILYVAGRFGQGEGGIWAVAVMLVAELAMYLPLGVRTDEFLEARCWLFAASLPVAILAARQKYRSALAGFGLGLVFYGAFIVPRCSLPDNIDLSRPPRSLVWLKEHVGNHARSWGVQPDFSSVLRVQDLGAIGPLAPRSFQEFIRLTTDDASYHNYVLSTYNLLGAFYWSYPLELYLAYKPIFDACSLRYLYLNKDYFGAGRRQDETRLQGGAANLRVAYEDDRVKILESTEAKPKVGFHQAFLIEPDHAAVLARLRAVPIAAAGPPMLERTDRALGPEVTSGPTPVTPQSEPTIASYRPNSVEIKVRSAGAGLLVLNDAYDQGWRAQVDGVEAPILRVNGLFRGVFVRSAGVHQVRFYYLPKSFVRGGLWSLLLLGYLVWTVWLARREVCEGSAGEVSLARSGLGLFWSSGMVLGGLTIGLILVTYFTAW
jgi:hypothetical protein